MFDTYEEFKAVVGRARGEFATRLHAVLKEACACADRDVTVRFCCVHPTGIEFDVSAGCPGDGVLFRYYLPYDESCWDFELKKVDYVVRYVRENAPDV